MHGWIDILRSTLVMFSVTYGCTKWFVKGTDTRFYGFPYDSEWRKRWVMATRRRDWAPTENIRICSDHSVKGMDTLSIAVAIASYVTFRYGYTVYCGSHSLVCSRVTTGMMVVLTPGRPSSNPQDPDYVPSIFAFIKPPKASTLARSERTERRHARQQKQEEGKDKAEHERKEL